MTKPPVTNMSASVHQRLKNEAEKTGQTFNDLLQHYGLERFLYRLSRSEYADRFILKGALLLRIWELSSIRATRDIDLLGQVSKEADSIAAIMREICMVAVKDDGLVFDVESIQVSTITEDAEYEGLRVEFKGYLGKALIPMQVDVGFGDLITPEPQVVDYPVVLDMDAPRLKCYPPETSIAEKFQVMLYRGTLNSRMKDFYDIWVLRNSCAFQGRVLAEAIRRTCAHRRTTIEVQPQVFTEEAVNDPTKQVQWNAFRRRLRDTESPASFVDVVHDIAGFLEPVAEALVRDAAFEKQWNPGGPWV